ncbi:MAG TPA: enoyl-CoA hydratase-related protein [Luteitalea sp.]|nr:enoyl-CoA hydratase-related protein [Luteitalea sp.]
MSGLRIDRRDHEVWLTLDRPEVRNAFDDGLIARLTEAARQLAPDPSVHVVVLQGAGPSFCAGADLAWMQRMRDYDRERNLADAKAAAGMFHALAELPMPVVARVQGAALGGGAGLLAVSDIVVAADDAQFGFTEARLGILPAVISPYVVRRIGITAARALFLGAHRIDAREAHRIGLVNEICPSADLDARVRARLDDLALGAPTAHVATKGVLNTLAMLPDDGLRTYTAAVLAEQRVSDEGQEGLRAFLEKRTPRWHPRHSGDA